MGFRTGFQLPNLINKSTLASVKPVKMCPGGSFLVFLSDTKEAYGMGESRNGQLGKGELTYQFSFIHLGQEEHTEIVDVAAGYQHTLLINSKGNYQEPVENSKGRRQGIWVWIWTMQLATVHHIRRELLQYRRSKYFYSCSS